MDAAIHRTQIILLVSVLFIHLIVLVWDIWAMFSGHETHTISAIVRAWSHEHPILPLAVGILIGHLFF